MRIQNLILCLPSALSALFLLSEAQAQTATYLDSFPMPLSVGNPDASQPYGLALDSSAGFLYVADYEFTHSRVVRFTTSGTFDLEWGVKGTGNGQFTNPTGIAIGHTAGRIYVCDFSNNRVQTFDTSGNWQATWTNPIGQAGQGISLPSGLGVFEKNQQVYLGDSARVLRLTSTGGYQGQWGNTGSGDGQFGNAGPGGIGVNQSTGQIYVTDPSNRRVERFNSGGVFELAFGSFGSGDGQFASPSYVAVDAAGNVYVTDQSGRVERFSADGVFQLSFGSSGSGDGQFNSPRGIAVSDAGIVYVADQNNGRIQRWQITEPVLPSPAPAVSINGKKKISTTASKILIKGSASDVNGTLSRVEVKVGSAGYKATSGTTSWKFSAKLKPGKNSVLVRAVDVAGATSAVAKITITRE
ncbi:MAG TPA: hypothetical protein VNB29_09675 [Chthoniobacterales bacterium]|nr:hypothetical protein [Chthoniobacterales bacterium]